jgi:hypothetical protein
MTQVIVYPNDNGGVVLCYPCECGLPVEEIARKDVPAGKPYLLVPADQVPTDHIFFAAFEANFSIPDGHGIGAQAWFIEQYRNEIAAINAEPLPARLPDDVQTPEQYDESVAAWESGKAQRIEHLNKQIAVQQAEMAT